jgi:hypothetical protein
MTRDEWIDQTTELEWTMPDQDDAPHRELRRQMWRRLLDIRDYLGGAGPEPAADWRPTVPDLTEAEKEAQRAKADEWFAGEMEGMKRDLAEMEAEATREGRQDRGDGEPQIAQMDADGDGTEA